jgi:histone acetyltransferase MYST1
VIQTRPSATGAAGALDGAGALAGAGALDFYVHYTGFDRRLDAWVSSDRLVPGTLEAREGGGEGAMPQERTRHKRRHEEAVDPAVVALEKEHEELTKVKNISRVAMGEWEVDTWYYSPYPDEYAGVDRLYVCEFCLKYMRHKKTHVKHTDSCRCRCPPGKEIYREEAKKEGESTIAVFEIDGQEEPVYCQNL